MAGKQMEAPNGPREPFGALATVQPAAASLSVLGVFRVQSKLIAKKTRTQAVATILLTV
jgi:hypothetical protein